MQQIRIHRKRRIAALIHRHGNLVLLGKRDQIGAAFKIPLAPRGDHFNIRVQRIGRKLKAHLIIALARGPMGNRISPSFRRNLNQALGNQWPRN